jgi:uncharacterized damage-inducible protein DinB
MPSSQALLGFGLRARTDLQHANVGEIAVALIVVQAIANHKFVGNGEAGIIGVHLGDAALGFIEKDSNPEMLRLALFEELYEKFQGEAGIQNILDNQNRAALDGDFQVLGEFHFARRIGAMAIAGNAEKIEGHFSAKLASEIGKEKYRAFEDADEVDGFIGEIAAYVLRDFADAAADVGVRDQDAHGFVRAVADFPFRFPVQLFSQAANLPSTNSPSVIADNILDASKVRLLSFGMNFSMLCAVASCVNSGERGARKQSAMKEREIKPEPWLRGTLLEVPAVPRAVLHALELAKEDLHKWCETLTDEQLNARPGGVASVAFQLRHIGGSIDRLLSYAEGRPLSAEQLLFLKGELDRTETKADIFRFLDQTCALAAARIRTLATHNLEEPRTVGRRELPTTLGGLLVHVADHTQRHVGQAITTARIVAGS